MMEQPVPILVVEDDPSLGRLLQVSLEQAGYAVTVVGRLGDAVTVLQRRPVALVITDIALPDGSGLDLIRNSIPSRETTKAVVITGGATMPRVLEAARIGAFDLIVKPFTVSTLLQVVGAAVSKHKDL